MIQVYSAFLGLLAYDTLVTNWVGREIKVGVGNFKDVMCT